MHLSERQTEILHRARALGRVEVEALAAEFAVTTQTIRRDLNELSQSGLLARVHGGAVPTARVANVAYAERRGGGSSAGEAAIGERAAAMIPDGCSVILNIGTTTEEVARALVDRRDLVVITNNLNVVGDPVGDAGQGASSWPAASCGRPTGRSSATRRSSSSASSRPTSR